MATAIAKSVNRLCTHCATVADVAYAAMIHPRNPNPAAPPRMENTIASLRSILTRPRNGSRIVLVPKTPTRGKGDGINGLYGH